eukprot:scaffold226534_cov35-Tisochrysis_lutea.AAC.4
MQVPPIPGVPGTREQQFWFDDADYDAPKDKELHARWTFFTRLSVGYTDSRVYGGPTGPGVLLTPGGPAFESLSVRLVLHDSSDIERKGLTLRECVPVLSTSGDIHVNPAQHPPLPPVHFSPRVLTECIRFINTFPGQHTDHKTHHGCLKSISEGCAIHRPGLLFLAPRLTTPSPLFCRCYSKLAPHLSESPIMFMANNVSGFELNATGPQNLSPSLRVAIDQASATGVELVIIGFGAAGWCGLCKSQRESAAFRRYVAPKWTSLVG